MRSTRTFRARVAAVALLTTAVALAVALGLFAARQWRLEREAMAQRRTVMANVIAANVSGSLIFNDRVTARRILESAEGIPDVRSVSVLDKSGRLFAAYGPPGSPAPSHPRSPAWVFTHDALEIRTPVRVDQEPIGELVLVSALDGLHRTFLGYAIFAVVLFLSVTGAATWAALWLARRVIAPVERLSEAMRQVRERGDFSQTVDAASDRELARLTDEFNAMLATLDGTMGALVQARDAAEAANRLKTEFLANMSHEIRTPLNGVLGMAQIMASEDLPEAQRRRLDVVRSSGASLLAILNDVLDIAKIEAGELELVPAPFQPASVLREACDSFAAMAEAKGLSFQVTIDPAAGGVWEGDTVRFRQIVSNLASNAVKFTRAGGVEVRLTADESGLGLLVVDTGIGMPAEKLPQLFERFTQADASATREFGGTGLGLAICRELVQLMGGSIAVDSRVHEGSEFRVRLPLQRLIEETVHLSGGPVGAPEIRPSAQRLRVLAAEDNPLNATILKLLSEMLGYDLDLVGTGRAAVEAWSVGGYELVLMDVQMPDIDGLAATQAIRRIEARRELPRTPIIALTANVMSHQVREYLAAGMDDCVSKPIEVEALKAAVERARTARRGFPEPATAAEGG